MKRQLQEAWVLDVVDRVVAGKALEDDRVELKAQWPSEHRKAARRIAGHGNQAGGDTILWVIGVDEGARAVVDAGVVEMSEWWPQVERCFDELWPEVQYVSVPVAGGVVHALFFDTSRAPYMVTTDGRGGADREVPWREGTRVRTARRSEVLRSLVEEAKVPVLECFAGAIEFQYDAVATQVVPDASEVFIRLDLHMYLEALAPCTMPQHRWSATLAVGDQLIDVSADIRLLGPMRPVPQQTPRRLTAISFASQPVEPAGEIVAVSNSSLHVSGSDALKLTGTATVPFTDDLGDTVRTQESIGLALRLPLANSTRAATLHVDLHRDPDSGGKTRTLGNFVVRPPS
jgi:hypothetical protein